MSPSGESRSSSGRTSRSLSLTTGGITLLGVLLSIGTTVGMGLQADWWVRVLAGVGTTFLLAVVVKLGSSAGHGPLARLALWMIGPGEQADDAPDGGGSAAGRS